MYNNIARRSFISVHTDLENNYLPSTTIFSFLFPVLSVFYWRNFARPSTPTPLSGRPLISLIFHLNFALESVRFSTMFLNISIFDTVEVPSTSGPCVSVPEEGFGSTTLWAVGSVPSLLLLVSVLILLRQNLDRILEILNYVRACLRFSTPTREEVVGTNPPPPIVVCQGSPRNLTDSEIVERNALNDLVSPIESEV